MNLESPLKSTQRLLDPIDRTSEVLFGLIMALTFTCSMSAGELGREEVRTLLVGAIGCNVAWGLVDAVVYLMVSLTERARGIATLRAVKRAGDAQEACDIIAGALPPLVASVMTAEDLRSIRKRLDSVSLPPTRARLRQKDYLAALGVFLWVFLATFPVVVPFIFMKEPLAAMRTSNAIALVMLFLAGYSFGHYAQYRPLRMGLTMMIIGSVLVVITIALGG